MSSATRLGDLDTGHDACAPTALVSASPNVYINGRAAGRVGDSYAPHGLRIAVRLPAAQHLCLLTARLPGALVIP